MNPSTFDIVTALALAVPWIGIFLGLCNLEDKVEHLQETVDALRKDLQ